MSKFLDWFKPKNKGTVVIPSIDSSKQLHGIELIKQFTTDDEPKLADFPSKYFKVYWETFVEPISNGYGAIVRFYGFDGVGFIKESIFSAPSVVELKAQVNKEIRQVMSDNKR